jgi:hypothetical protein
MNVDLGATGSTGNRLAMAALDGAVTRIFRTAAGFRRAPQSSCTSAGYRSCRTGISEPAPSCNRAGYRHTPADNFSAASRQICSVAHPTECPSRIGTDLARCAPCLSGRMAGLGVHSGGAHFRTVSARPDRTCCLSNSTQACSSQAAAALRPAFHPNGGRAGSG